MRKALRYILLSLVLLLVFFASALMAMRFAIRGREVVVPALTGLTPGEAERAANASGLVLAVDTRYYTLNVPRGRIVSQTPAPGSRVRRGWRLLVAESLGPQRAAIPNLVGQSEHAADINISRHGMEVGSVATIHLEGVPAGTVAAQNPRANTTDAPSPRISLLLSAPDSPRSYVMPNFVGRHIATATDILEEAGFSVGTVLRISEPLDPGELPGPSGIILKQYPAAGRRIEAGATINFEVRE